MALTVHVSEVSRLLSRGLWYALIQVKDVTDTTTLLPGGRYYRCHDPEDVPSPPCPFLDSEPELGPAPCWDHFAQDITDALAIELDSMPAGPESADPLDGTTYEGETP